MSDDAKRFRDRAIDCRALAKSARSEIDATMLEDIAQSWTKRRGAAMLPRQLSASLIERKIRNRRYQAFVAPDFALTQSRQRLGLANRLFI
jgi:hypothetical protein